MSMQEFLQVSVSLAQWYEENLSVVYEEVFFIRCRHSLRKGQGCVHVSTASMETVRHCAQVRAQVTSHIFVVALNILWAPKNL